ncbi:MAG: hypothetical protein AMXMBFR6_06060 [Betaproteobacteria bacterium]
MIAAAIERGIRAQGIGRCPDRFLVARTEGAQCVLHAVAEPAQYPVVNVQRILRDEKHADTLGADQAHHLFDFLQQRRRRALEQQMRLVKEAPSTPFPTPAPPAPLGPSSCSSGNRPAGLA